MGIEGAINAPKQKHVLNDVPKGTIDAGEDRQKNYTRRRWKGFFAKKPLKVLFCFVLHSTYSYVISRRQLDKARADGKGEKNSKHNTLDRATNKTHLTRDDCVSGFSGHILKLKERGNKQQQHLRLIIVFNIINMPDVVKLELVSQENLSFLEEQ